MGVIYSIMNPKGKLYIGKTYDLRKRVNSHKCSSKKKSNCILHNSIKKYGWGNHLLSVIEEVDDIFLNEREIFWIKKLNTYCYENDNGMNMTFGGDGQRSTWMHDTKRREQASKNFSGEKNPFFGKKVSEENKKIIGDKAKYRNLKEGRTVPDWGAEKGKAITRVRILAYNSKGDFIGDYISITEAGHQLGISRKAVTSVLINYVSNYKGLVFRYHTEQYKLNIDVSHIPFLKMKRPILLFNRDRQLIKEYSQSKEAADELGIRVGNINRAALSYNYNCLRGTEYAFAYKDEHEEKLRNQLN